MTHFKPRCGFALMELLVVMAIISLMAVLAFAATNGTRGSVSSKQGAVMASEVLALARSEAIEKQGYAVLVIDAYPDSSNPNNFLHRMMVADATTVSGSGINTFTQASEWYNLPSSVYFDPAWSTQSTTVPATINNSTGEIFNGPVYVYTFSPIGQLVNPGQLVLAVGHESSAPCLPVFQDGTSGTPDTREGFYLHQLGRPSFFLNSASISLAMR